MRIILFFLFSFYNFYLYSQSTDLKKEYIDPVISFRNSILEFKKNFIEKQDEFIKIDLILKTEIKKVENDLKTLDNMITFINNINDYSETIEIKTINEDDKKIIIEALWEIIYSDANADMYETNLMRRLSGLLYLDNKIVGDIKEKIKNKKS